MEGREQSRGEARKGGRAAEDGRSRVGRKYGWRQRFYFVLFYFLYFLLQIGTGLWVVLLAGEPGFLSYLRLFGSDLFYFFVLFCFVYNWEDTQAEKREIGRGREEEREDYPARRPPSTQGSRTKRRRKTNVQMGQEGGYNPKQEDRSGGVPQWSPKARTKNPTLYSN
jgi:hypothetical protein